VNDSEIPNRSPRAFHQIVAQLFENTTKITPVVWVRQYASEPLVEILKLYRLLVFSWWTGNGDMHLKNFSLQTDEEGHQRLTPAYDLVCTRLVIPDDPFALPVQGKDRNLTRGTWLKFADDCQIPRKAAERVLAEHTDVLDQAVDVVARCFLSSGMKEDYQDLLRSRTEALLGAT
jgi:serine/threonine-protein kinase HipA